MSQQDLAAVKAAAIDGRAQTIFYKLTQLENLRNALVDRAIHIQDGIRSDSNSSPLEAKVEYSLALEALRARYSELADFDKVLDQEYRVAKGHSDPNRRHGVGIAVIKPCPHTLFYSTIAPLVAAIAAGNVVIVQFENSTRALPGTLKTLLKAALDPDSIAFTSSAPRLDVPHVVSSSQAEPASQFPSNLVCSSTGPCIAVVDRNVDFDVAAKALINARFSYGGRSPNAPDLVLVNEFAKKPLLQALVRASIASTDGPNQSSNPMTSSSLKSLLSEFEKLDARIIVQESSGAVLELPRRTPSLLTRKIDVAALLVHPIRSLDDAIDFLTTDPNTVFSAAYHFADAGSAKYLSQFVPAHASFHNHVPVEVLVGPGFPLGWPVDVSPAGRFRPEMFSAPRSAFVPDTKKKTLSSSSSSGTELTSSQAERRDAVARLYAAATALLPVKKRRKQLAAGFGYFEQAFLTHFGLAVLTTLVSLGATGYWLKAGRGWRPWR